MMTPKLSGPAQVLTHITTVGSWNNNPDRTLNHDPVPKAKDMICSIRPPVPPLSQCPVLRALVSPVFAPPLHGPMSKVWIEE